MRAFARVVVLAALLGTGIPIALSGPIASAAPTTDTRSSSTQFDLYSLADDPRPAPTNRLFTEDFGGLPPAIPVVLQNNGSSSNSVEPAAQSPAIALPPAVASGFGLLCVLAVCMGLRRFAYRPATISRRY